MFFWFIDRIKRVAKVHGDEFGHFAFKIDYIAARKLVKHCDRTLATVLL